MSLLRSFCFMEKPDYTLAKPAEYLIFASRISKRYEEYVVEIFDALINDRLRNKIDWENVGRAYRTGNLDDMKDEIRKVWGYAKGIEKYQKINKNKKDWKLVHIYEEGTENEYGVSESYAIAHVIQKDKLDALTDKMDVDLLIEELYANRRRIKKAYRFDIIDELKNALNYYINNIETKAQTGSTRKLKKLKENGDKTGELLWNLLESEKADAILKKIV